MPLILGSVVDRVAYCSGVAGGKPWLPNDGRVNAFGGRCADRRKALGDGSFPIAQDVL